MSITTIEINCVRAVGRELAVGERPDRTNPGGKAAELIRRYKVGAESISLEAETSLPMLRKPRGWGLSMGVWLGDGVPGKFHQRWLVFCITSSDRLENHEKLTLVPSSTLQISGSCVALLHQGGQATIDHFLRGPLEAEGKRIVMVDSAQRPSATTLKELGGCSLIVVVRYLPRPWLKPLARLRAAGHTLAYLMDDDLLDPSVHRLLPPTYRRRLWERVTRLHRRLPRLVDHLWVTSTWLDEKYGHLGVELLPLAPHPDLLTDQPRLQLAYLGTSVHEAEFIWLLPLLESLQKRHRHTHVELFGDLAINRRFRHLPRLRILHPMSWDNYLAETGHGRVDILLTPLLPEPFNAARAAVKVIDAARCGAAGLYSDREPYRSAIQNGVDGLLLDDDQESWLSAIERLISDPEERRRLAAAGQQRALQLSLNPGEKLPHSTQNP